MRIIILLLVVSCSDEATFTTITHNVNANISGELYTDFLTPDNRNNNNLDILLVIDNSQSMAEKREKLSEKLTPLLSKVQDRSWQIAITTTNANRKCLEALIDNNTPDYQGLYQKAIEGLGDSVSNYEQAIKMVIASLRGELSVCGQPDSSDTFWLQEDSMLAILIITDEDHQCSKSVTNEACDPDDLYNFLRVAGRTLNLTTKVYGLLDPEKNSKFLAWTDSAGESIFTRHEPLDTDYDSLLTDISQQLSSGMQFTFDLAKNYNGEASEIVIYFGDDERILDQGEYGFIDDKLIIISKIPDNTDKIKATYSYQP